MTYADIPLIPSIQRIVDRLSDAVWRGRRALVAQFGTPHDIRRSNARAFGDVRLLQRLLRYIFIILAPWIDLPARKATVTPQRARTLAAPDRAPLAHSGERPARMAVSRLRRMRVGGERPQPAPLTNAARDPVRTLARHVDALTHALLCPMPYIRRLARRLRRDVCAIGWRLPKRPPPLNRRGGWEELVLAREQARWELRERRWLKRADSS